MYTSSSRRADRAHDSHEEGAIIQGTAARPVLLLTTAVMAVGIYLPFSRLGSAAGMARLPWTYFPWLAVTLLAYCALTQGVKTWYIWRLHAWL